MEDRQKSPRTRSDRGFVPQSRKSMSRLSCTYCKSTGCKCYKSSPGRGSFSSVCGSMESYYSRKMDFTAGTGRSQLAICKDSDRKRNKRDKVCRYSENYLYIRRGRKLVRKKCHRESSKTARRPRVLQHLFHCAEKRRRISTNFKSAKSQFVPCCSTLQDGNIAANNLCSGERRLGSVNRPQGCILSCSSPSEVQEIPSILHTGEAFPISRNAVWIGDSAKDIHQTNVRCGKLPEVTSDTDLHVFGRLADQESGQTSTKTTDFASLGGDSRARSVSELDKVSVGTNTDHSVPWFSFFPQGWSCLSNNGQISQVARSVAESVVSGSGHGSNVSTVVRPYGFFHRSDSIFPPTHATYPILCPVMVETTQRQHVSDDSGQGNLIPAFTMVDQVQQSVCWDSSSYSAYNNNLDRCVNVRMGSSHGGSAGFGCVEPSTICTTHQLARTESSGSSIASFSTSNCREVGSSQMRQFNRSVLHQQTGRDQILPDVLPSMGSVSMVSSEGYCFEGGTHTREKEHFGGSLVERRIPCENNGVVSLSGNSENNLRYIHDSEYRPIRNQGEQEAADILLSLSGSLGMGNRCPQCQLDRDVCICFSSSYSYSPGTEESTERGMCSTASGTICTTSVLVSSTSKSVGGISKETSGTGRNVNSKTRTIRASKSRKLKSGSLENNKKSKSAKRFSKKAREYIKQSRRSSTRQMYDARLSIYRSWCDQRQISPHSATVEDVANFLIYVHEIRGGKAATVAGYRSAIATIHDGWRGTPVGLNKDLSNLIKGIFNSNPEVKPLLPNWDLPTVLWALCEEPFEPINAADIKYVTWKTVFLMALATAARVSELHALSVKETNLRFESGGIRLLPNFQFLSKTQRMGKPWSPLFISNFANFATEPKDLLLCPCRALKEYLKRMRSYHTGETEQLFLTYQKGVRKPAAKSTLSRWIVSLIRYVYDKQPAMSLSRVRGHDTRRLASSWALFNGASVQEILQAAHWASENTFTSYYLKDVVWNDNILARAAVLDTARWARGRRK